MSDGRRPGWVTVLPISASAARERAQRLRDVRATLQPGENPELYAALTDAAATFAAAVDLDPTPRGGDTQ